MSHTSTKRSAIIKSAISIIESQGLDKLTYAKIAKLSKLKIDTVKSIYKDIDDLVESVYKKTLKDEFVNSLKVTRQKYGHNPKLFLSHLISSVLKGLIDHPRILKAHFHGNFINQDTNTTSVTLLRNFTDEILHIILGPNPDSVLYKNTKLKLQQSISSILFIGLFKDIFNDINYTAWVKSLVDYILS